ncbi:hypothetical protein LQ938_11505 [Microbacterium sp. cx-55]|uniref:hypothetical protein n=1 Tax=Microbacterium sp. cx-55 TaxID=2875948 RepID=UPI001CBD2F5B|nr:hypothetical protein [Microbacterium sp. cx-55]MBZ4488099.1 hypothetical protein [Microbacterium sp. cx-55]UGB34492.1 hypothetical protein LQ938_11505 [Microbacterium sp. cx-55]
MSADADRYDGKLMLRLLDAYVLDALGALDAATAQANAANAVKIASALSAPGLTWQGSVESAMQMPPDSQDALRTLWERHVHQTIARGKTPNVIAWTHELVDSRFNE